MFFHHRKGHASRKIADKIIFYTGYSAYWMLDEMIIVLEMN
jgi:hypothetical protein